MHRYSGRLCHVLLVKCDMPSKPVKQDPAKGLWLRGDTYWLAATLPGYGRIRISLKTADMAEAIVEARKVRLFPERYLGEQSGSLLEEFFAHQERRGVSASHLKNTRRILTQFQGDGKLESISVTAANKWWTKTLQETAPVSAKAYLKAVVFFYKWAIGAGKVKTSPVALIVPPKVRPSVRKSFLVPADALRVLDACEDEDLKFCLYCALHCGLRRGEVVAARPHWFDQTPSLPVPRPANDATREKQIPFRKSLCSCLRSKLPASKAPSTIRQVPFVSPSHPAKLLPSKSGAGAASTEMTAVTVATKATQNRKKDCISWFL